MRPEILLSRQLAKKMTVLLADLLDNADIVIDEHYVVFRAPNSTEGREKLCAIHKELAALTFHDALSLEEESEGLQLVVNTGTDSWSKRCPLYLNVSHFWGAVRFDDCLPDFYFVCDARVGSWQDKESNVSKIKTYFIWKHVFKELSDHKGTSSSPNAFVYFVSTDKGAKIYEVTPPVSLAELEFFKFDSESHGVASELRDLIGIKDAHIRERRDVLRTTLSELLDEDHSESSFRWVVTQHKRFQKKFRENYDVYVHRFSVNKLLGEIEEKVSDYISKINESVSSSQNKAFAIPGALIAIAALIKNQDVSSVLLVCIGLYFVMLLTRTANAIYLEAFETLEGQIKKSLSRYEIIKDEDEVRVSAEEAKTKLIHLLDAAKGRLGVIDGLAIAMFVFGVVYGIVVLFGEDLTSISKQYGVPLIQRFFDFISAQPSFDRWSWLQRLL